MESTSFMQSAVAAFQGGGNWMFPIAVALAISVAFTLERFVRLFLQYNVDGASFMFEVQKHILANDIDGAIRLCNGAGNAALPKVIKAGLQRSSREGEQIQNAIDAASLEVIPKLERRLSYLSLIANLSTLLGLLGTISGLIGAFGAIALADPSQRQAILVEGHFRSHELHGLRSAHRHFHDDRAQPSDEQSQPDSRGNRRVRREAPGSAVRA